MNEIRIYVANLGKYNEGILQGEWFTLPHDIEDIYVQIGVGQYDEDGNYTHGVVERDAQGNEYFYEEWAIHDYEAPFRISEYESIKKLNEIAEAFEGLTDEQIEIVGKLVDDGIAQDYDDAIERLDNCRVWSECKSMEEVAMEYADMNGSWDAIKDTELRHFIDWEAAGRTLEINGTFFELENGTIVEYLG